MKIHKKEICNALDGMCSRAEQPDRSNRASEIDPGCPQMAFGLALLLGGSVSEALVCSSPPGGDGCGSCSPSEPLADVCSIGCAWSLLELGLVGSMGAGEHAS